MSDFDEMYMLECEVCHHYIKGEVHTVMIGCFQKEVCTKCCDNYINIQDEVREDRRLGD